MYPEDPRPLIVEVNCVVETYPIVPSPWIVEVILLCETAAATVET